VAAGPVVLIVLQSVNFVYSEPSFVLYLVKMLFEVGICSVNRLPTDLSPVVDAYEHALLASYPRPRYMVGAGAGFVALLAALPDSIGDWLMSVTYRR